MSLRLRSGPPHLFKLVVVDKQGHITCESFCSSKSYFIALKLYLLDCTAMMLGWKSAPIICTGYYQIENIDLSVFVYMCVCMNTTIV